MKHMKKIVSLMLAAVMVLAMTVTVSAKDVTVGGGPAEIEVTNATKGATYTLYKVFDATVNTASASDVKIAYSWPEGKIWENNDYFAKDERGNISAKDAAFKTAGSDQLSDGAIEWIKLNATKVIEATANDQTLVFKDLEYGYYYVTSTVNKGGAITVTSTMPTASVIDKNQEPSWPGDGKNIVLADGTKVTESHNAFSDSVNYEINVTAPAYFKDEMILEYFIKDTIADGLEYVQDSLQVFVGETKLEADGYTVAWDDPVAPATTTHGFKITIPWANYDADNKPTTPKYDTNSTIIVKYTATVDTDAVIAGEGNKNTASYDFRTDKDDPDKKDPWHETEEKTTTTYTYALGIQKTDTKGNPLAGATFTIEGVQGVKVSDGVYNYVPEGYVAKEGETVVTEFETDNAGKLTIKGVKDGAYTVTEAKAPDGYNLLTETATITAKKTGETTYTHVHTIYYDADGNVVDEKDESTKSTTVEFPVDIAAITVVNNAGNQLPSTGGIGTTLFYIIGGVLVLGALVLLVTKKRMGRE